MLFLQVQEDFSPITRLQWALGTAPESEDVMPYSPVTSCAPPATWCSACDEALGSGLALDLEERVPLDGRGCWPHAPTNVSGMPSGNNSYTIEAWVEVQADANPVDIVSWGLTGAGEGSALRVLNATNGVQLLINSWGEADPASAAIPGSVAAAAIPGSVSPSCPSCRLMSACDMSRRR